MGQITGTLLDFDGRPIPGVGVVLKRLGVPFTVDGPQAKTDDRGKFTFDALLPGAYSFAFPPDTDDYGEPKVYRPGDTVTLRSAWMGKGCAITGMVANSLGEPLIEAPVHASRIRNSEGAAERPAFNWSGGESGVLTDDRGIYRIWGIAPGSYLVSAGGKVFQNWGAPGPYDEDAPTYYPSASLADAKVVQVVSGQEAAGIDIKYIGDAGHRITGAVRGFNHADGQNGGVMISLTQASTGRVQAFISVRGSEESPTYAIASVPDGEYCISGLQVWDNDLKASSACRTIEVKGADVTGADIVMVPLASISGKLSLEQASVTNKDADCQSSNRTAGISPADSALAARAGAPTVDPRISDSLISVSSDDAPGADSGSPLLNMFTPAAIPDDKGDFTMSKVAAGRYQLSINLPSKDWYVAGLTRSDAGSKRKPIEYDVALRAGENLTGLAISVRRGAAAVSGRVVAGSEGKSLPPLLRVYLVPLEQGATANAANAAGAIATGQRAELGGAQSTSTASQHRTEASQAPLAQPPALVVPLVLRYREAEVLSDGTFDLTNLAPGVYRLVAMQRPTDATSGSNRPLTRSFDGRSKLSRESVNHGTELDLNPCARTSGVVLKY